MRPESRGSIATRARPMLLWAAQRIGGQKESALGKQMTAIRIGEILVEQGVLTEQQVFEIVAAQRERGVPFGVLAERMFEVSV